KRVVALSFGAPRAPARGRSLVHALVAAGVHRPQLRDAKSTALVTYALLAEKRISRALQQDGERHQQDERESDHQRDRSQHQVEGTLPPQRRECAKPRPEQRLRHVHAGHLLSSSRVVIYGAKVLTAPPPSRRRRRAGPAQPAHRSALRPTRQRLALATSVRSRGAPRSSSPGGHSAP